jgi:PTH1 family peptidyl-tRNA hydrolase
MKLIIGLGNPGKEYELTRHNAGFLAVNALAVSEDGVWKNDDKRKAEVCKIEVNGESVILAKPTTFMNASGEAVQALLSFYKVPLEDLLIVHDEMDVAPQQLRFKQGGGDAGHNGLTSIMESLGTDNFVRLRLGIGRPLGEHRPPTSDYVLGPLSPKDDLNILDVVAGMRDWIESGTEKAMNRWNQK